jgi:branched-chain amino acid transport system permease protein
MPFSTEILTTQQVLNIISDASVLFVLAAGLAVIFGLMNVINFAHGGFIAIGAYAASIVTAQDMSPWLFIPAGLLFGAVSGFIVERVFMRLLYQRPWDTILATIGLQLVIVAVISLIFGLGNRYVNSPVSGQLDLGFAHYSPYRVLVVGVAIVLAAAWIFVERRTQYGLIARAVMANDGLASGLGIDTQRVRQVTFVVGCALAGMAGAVIAPLSAVQPNMGDSYLVSAFLVVLIAGSSVLGVALASLILGGTGSWITFISSPIVGSLAVIVLAAAILRIIPGGFHGLHVSGEKLARLRNKVGGRS